MEIHKHTSRYDQAMEIRLQWRNVELSQSSREMGFILYGIKGDEMMKGVTQFKYMGIPLD